MQYRISETVFFYFAIKFLFIFFIFCLPYKTSSKEPMEFSAISNFRHLATDPQKLKVEKRVP